MARIDFIALQQRLAQQQPKPATTMPAEPPSWSTRPTPASALRTTPAPKAPPATTSAATLTGTLRATTTMRATLPLKATSAREERARANALQAQIDELNAALAVANAEADWLKERVEALSAEVVRAERQAAGAEVRAGRAEAATAGERSRADVLRDRVDGLQQDLLASQAVASELMAGRALMMDMHARELAAQHDTLAAQQAAAELRQADDNVRKARGLLTRLKAAWRGE